MKIKINKKLLMESGLPIIEEMNYAGHLLYDKNDPDSVEARSLRAKYILNNRKINKYYDELYNGHKEIEKDYDQKASLISPKIEDQKINKDDVANKDYSKLFNSSQSKNEDKSTRIDQFNNGLDQKYNKDQLYKTMYQLSKQLTSISDKRIPHIDFYKSNVLQGRSISSKLPENAQPNLDPNYYRIPNQLKETLRKHNLDYSDRDQVMKAIYPDAPNHNESYYKELKKQYPMANLPHEDEVFRPYTYYKNNREKFNNPGTNTSNESSPFTEQMFDKYKYSFEQDELRKINQPLMKKKTKLIGGGLLGGGILGGGIAYNTLSENEYFPNLGNEEDSTFLQNASEMAGIAGLAHIGQNFASLRTLNTKNGEKTVDSYMKTTTGKSKTSDHIKEGLSNVVAPEKGVLDDHVHEILHGLTKEKTNQNVKDAELMHQLLQGKFAEALANPNLPESQRAYEFAKNQLKLPVDEIIKKNNQYRADANANFTQDGIVAETRKFTQPYEDIYKDSKLGKYGIGLGNGLEKYKETIFDNSPEPANTELAKRQKIIDRSRIIGTLGLGVAEPLAGALTATKFALSKKYDENKNPRMVGLQNVFNQALVKGPSEVNYYSNLAVDPNKKLQNLENYEGPDKATIGAMKYGGNAVAGELADISGKMGHLAKIDNFAKVSAQNIYDTASTFNKIRENNINNTKHVDDYYHKYYPGQAEMDRNKFKTHVEDSHESADAFYNKNRENAKLARQYNKQNIINGLKQFVTGNIQPQFKIQR